jgi:hypothetical protein
MNKLTVFEQKEIRQIEHNGEIWFSIIDIIEILASSINPQSYWGKLKEREPQLLTVCKKIKLMGKDGKSRPSDCVNTESAFVIIMSIPSPKAHTLRLWIAQASKEKLESLQEFKTVGALVLNHAKLNNLSLICEPKTYLMWDTFRGYYKIGKSRDPKIREATLQAEVPSIELLHVIEDNIETYLHKKFDSKRLRGEWFDLSQSDIDYIKSY